MAGTPNNLITLGYEARRNGRLQQAKDFFSESLGLSRSGNDRSGLASSLTGLGQIERDLKNHRAAIQHYREAVGILRDEPDQLRLAHTIRHLADLLRESGSLVNARSHYDEALQIYRKDSRTPPLDLANAIRGFALLKGELGDTEAAKFLWQEARSLYQSVNVQAGVEESESQVARLAVQ